MMRSLYGSLVLCLLSVLLASCASFGNKAPEKGKSSAVKQADILLLPKFGDQAVRDIFQGIEKQDYKLFIAHFMPEYRKEMSSRQFTEMARNFNKAHGKLKSLRYLGCIHKNTFKILIWSGTFTRSAAQENAMKKAGMDPESIPVPEALVQIYATSLDGQWKVLNFTLL